MGDDFPDEGFTDSESFLFGLIDDFAEVAFVGVLHEDVNVLFGAVKETLLESDDVGVIKRGEDSDLIGGVIFFVVAKAKTFDLHKMGITFFMAMGFSYYFLLTKKTFPYDPTPSFFMNL